MVGEKVKYWNNFYLSDKSQSSESNFARFVVEKFPDFENIIDIGCGNGRDSLFFASKGYNVVGIDASKTAIDNCKKISENMNASIYFMEIDVKKLDFNYFSNLFDLKYSKTILYARFFLHAISKETEENFLKLFSRLAKLNAKLCLEFRCSQDRDLKKLYPNHYRRFIDFKEFIKEIGSYRLYAEYAECGQGFSVLDEEDPFTARVILCGINDKT